ncbi:Cation-independent mannose-6-phosphate receptor CI-MPR [Exophiala xenobiotica]|nr:Cation-independent mannose-6-phosphate receptor CI-MPR [Exophiala xenobiotica]KAK5243482.1 Cation-independent mannose-6-phosphate receptor CI-MPR [Exophiala xenobiotica]KAK5351917.1 Cation-independent mannose-6-phosphate receptor CI-MPR [Exophiala xenobiotica]KAK5371419.1 Cation-independent mannose-6-phosphate receptor CI-MPR [Exophiala xenobiotica]KAK5380845.1 Cation-independent mannose-6-phosphate receptor CI-MPR [Exophiala xenobiotica]
MYIPTTISLLLLSFISSSAASSEAKPKPPPKPCTIHSTSTGSFFDLRPLQLALDGTKYQTATNESFHARGFDYPANFTMNFCGPVVEPLDDVEGIPSSRVANVSAYYKNQRGDIYSIGQQNDELIFRGKKLLLNYTMGSPCPELDEAGIPIDQDVVASKDRKRRKSTLFSFICDTSPSLSTRPAISFLGSPDHCTYIFEVRSRYACGGTTQSEEKGTLGPGAVFGVILGIALLVYLIGGVVYHRNVMHQRGWKQLPNYSVWAGLFSFISDMFIILFSSCTQRMPPGVTQLFAGRRGYHRVGTDERVGRGRTPDDENRLIDQLDEEWED